MAESEVRPRTEPLGIGERLRNAREAKGLSLRAVADLTRIRAIYLQALEDERFEQLPGTVYARGFLRMYADALGLDADRLLDAYPGALEPPPPSPIGTTGVEIPIQPAAPRSRVRIIATYVAAVLSAGLLIIGIVGYVQLREFNRPVPPQAVAPPESPTPAPATPPAAAPQTPATTEPPIAAPEVPPTPQEAPQPAAIDGVTLEVRAEGTSWLRVTADGQRVFQGLLHEGDTQTWQARRRLTVRVGNMPVVQVTIDGRRVTAPPGKRVWEQTFTKQ